MEPSLALLPDDVVGLAAQATVSQSQMRGDAQQGPFLLYLLRECVEGSETLLEGRHHGGTRRHRWCCLAVLLVTAAPDWENSPLLGFWQVPRELWCER